MKKVTTLLLIFMMVAGLAFKARAWGFWAHQRINRMAIFTLPPELLRIYKVNIQYMTEHAVDPDKRRYAVDGEAPRHYIDIDHYGENPFEIMPRRWKDAVAKFTEDTLMAYGIVPWHIQKDYYRLVRAFKERNLQRILKISSDLGHYIGDSNVPLHTTENYNGQMTGQKGIHGFWESRLPEIYGETYEFFVGRAKFIENPLDEAWNSVTESHAALDSVLDFERELTERYPSDKKYSYENRGNVLQRVYSKEFSAAYHDMLNGMVERRMRMAIYRVGSFWYSAWVEAGQPDLSDLLEKEVDQEAPKNYDKKLDIKDREAQGVGMLEDEPCEEWSRIAYLIAVNKDNPIVGYTQGIIFND